MRLLGKHYLDTSMYIVMIHGNYQRAGLTGLDCQLPDAFYGFPVKYFWS